MSSPVRLYQQEMHNNLGFFATWLPSDRIEVGDAGVLDAGRFRKMTSLKDLGIEYSVEEGEATQDLKYTATQGTSISTSADAAAAKLLKAEITVEFSRNGAFVFHASALRQRSIQDRPSVAERLTPMVERGRWQKEWLLVESLHTAECATIIVSEESSAGLVLSASSDAPLLGISLADPSVALTITSTRGRIVHVIGGKGLHPLYSCLRLKHKLFGSPSLQPVRGAGVAEVPFSRPGIGELLDS